MRELFLKFRKEESGASLVEYAVALIVVTIVGGAGVILIGNDAGTLATCGSGVVAAAADDVSAAAPAGTPSLTC